MDRLSKYDNPTNVSSAGCSARSGIAANVRGNTKKSRRTFVTLKGDIIYRCTRETIMVLNINGHRIGKVPGGPIRSFVTRRAISNIKFGWDPPANKPGTGTKAKTSN